MFFVKRRWDQHFKECHSIRRLAFASKWGCRLDGWKVSNIEDLMDFYINSKPEACFQHMDRRTISTFLATLLYVVWNHRNQKIFSKNFCSLDLVFGFNRLAEEFLDAEEAEKNPSHLLKDIWKAHPEGWWKTNVDAAFVKGQAGIAFVIIDYKGNLLFYASQLICCHSPFEAELKTFTWAASMAADRNWDKICWLSDSSLVVNGITDQEEPAI